MKRSFGLRRLVSAFSPRRLADGRRGRLYDQNLFIVKSLTLLSCLIAGTAFAQTVSLPFKKPENFPVTFNLVLPKKNSTVVSHEQVGGFDTITARLDDDREGGFVVEAVDMSGKRLWRRDFGYNFSGVPGCSVAVSFHPKVNAVIVGYHGYKWDHNHILLFVTKTPSGYRIAEYSGEAPEIFQFLKVQPGYSEKHKYWIYPFKFVEDQIVFECTPLSPLELNSPHPLDQEVRWFDMTAPIDENFKITPTDAKPSY
jgi:hypothetical protein